MRNRCGFTVLELLVVISILSILAALLFPVFARAKESAKDTTCISGLRQVGVSTILYQGDWDDRLPLAVSAGTKFTAQLTPAVERKALFNAALGLPTIEQQLQSYGAASSIWKCALDRVEPLFISENSSLPPKLQWKTTYFLTYGSSYNYDDVTAVLHDGVETAPSSEAILFCDYAPVHGPSDLQCPGSRNLLFADGHAKLDIHNHWGVNFVPVSSGEWQ